MMNAATASVNYTPIGVSPVDALWTLIQSQTRTVRRTLAERLAREELSLTTKQQLMVEASMNNAVRELTGGKVKHDARSLFAH